MNPTGEYPTYTCAQCGDEFQTTWTDDEAMAEAEDVFGDALGPDPVVVCDDCYQMMNAAVPMRSWAADTGGDPQP